MKIRQLFFYAFLAVSISLTSCNKDDDNNANPDNPISGSGSMTAQVDGNDFDATLVVEGNYENDVLVVAGNNGQAQQIQITILNPDGTGTYPIGQSTTNPNMGLYVGGPSQEESYTTIVGVGAGSVEITEFTGSRVKGTFQFNARNTAGDEVEVTDGEFDVPLD